MEQVVVKSISNDFKKEIIKHDYKIAGYLYNKDLDNANLTYAFTREKTKEDFRVGQNLLQTAGYSDSTQNSFIPEVKNFYEKYALLTLIISIIFFISILAALSIFTILQNKKLEKANASIRCFMDGEIGIRLNDNDEGSLSKLFTSINCMATSLTAHISKEKKNKEFLKDTISDISHQLKTPLTALQMYNEIIQDENIQNDVVDKFTLKSQNELKRMENLIKNLLKLAKLDSGTIKLDKNEYNLKDFIEKAIKGFHTRAELENKPISLQCDDKITLNCDIEWLLEAVSNIIKNALDHTDHQDKIDIICDETTIVTTITIKDNGMGIHPEDIHYIFKRFYRSRFSKDKQGVGIGLTLSKFIVEKHGGSIMVESKLGRGTAFHLTFPKLTNL
jgi:signal transduction histidine kinase